MPAKRIDHPEWVEIHLPSKDAQKLVEILSESVRSAARKTVKEIKQKLRPKYVYDVKCTDCPRVFEISRHEEVSDAEIRKGGICVNCSDDYK